MVTRPHPNAGNARYRQQLNILQGAVYLLSVVVVAAAAYYYYAFVGVPASDVLANAAIILVGAFIVATTAFYFLRRVFSDIVQETQFRLEQNPELSALYETGTLLGATMPLSDILEASIDRMPFPPNVYSLILLVDPEQTRAEVVAAKGPQREQAVGAELYRDDVPPTFIDLLCQQKQPLVVPDVRSMLQQHYQRVITRLPILADTRAMVIFPLLIKDQPIGFLVVSSPLELNLTDAQFKMLSTFSRQVAAAVGNGRLVEAVNASQREWEATLDSLPEGVLVVNAEGSVERINAVFAGILGTDPGPVLGRSATEVLEASPPPVKESLSAIAERATRGEPARTEISVDGRHIVVACTVVPGRRGAPAGLAFVAQDLTQQGIWQEEMERRLQDREVLGSVACGATGSEDLGAVLDSALQRLAALPGGGAGWVYLAGQRPGDRPAVAIYGLPQAFGYEMADVLGPMLAARLSENGGRPLTVQDLPDSIELHSLVALEEGWRSAVVVPLRLNGSQLGHLGLVSHEDRPADEQRLAVLEKAAAHLASVVATSRLIQSVREEAEQWEKVAEWSQRVGGSLEQDRILELGIEAATELISSPDASFAVFLYDAEQQVFKAAAGSGLAGDVFKGVTFHPQQLTGNQEYALFSQGRVIGGPVEVGSSAVAAALASPLPLSHWALIPIAFQGEVLGGLALSDAIEHPADSPEMIRVASLTEAIGSALHSARTLEAERSSTASLREAEEQKTGFLYTALHEVRTPLSSLKVSVDLLNELGGANVGGEHYRRLVTNARRSVSRLDRLVSDLNDMNSLVSSNLELNLEECDIHELVAEAVGVMVPLVAGKRQSLEVDIPEEMPTLVVDRYRFGQILGNLLSNANKFSPPETVLALQVRPGGSDSILFSVQDEGPGVPEEDRERIFEPFFKQSVGGRATAGTGLGLTIARSLVNLHGGRIWVESGPEGKGSQFSFVLPLRPGIVVSASAPAKVGSSVPQLSPAGASEKAVAATGQDVEPENQDVGSENQNDVEPEKGNADDGLEAGQLAEAGSGSKDEEAASALAAETSVAEQDRGAEPALGDDGRAGQVRSPHGELL